MFSQTKALKRVEQRGPRWAIYGQIRSGEARTEHADTAEKAEKIRADFEDPRTCNYRQVTVHPPAGSGNLEALARDRSRAQAALTEATAVLRAAVLRALKENRAEAEVARAAGVDRMTVRSWAGKR